MSNLTVFGNAGLPSVGDLTSALRRVETTSEVSGDGVFLKMDRTGHWCFGADPTEIEEGSQWAVNPFSFVHGFIAWGAEKTPAHGTLLGEVMAPVTQPLPEHGPTPEHCEGWKVQIGCSVKCVSGEDKGLNARVSFISIGGKKALTGLGLAIAAQVEKDPTRPVPIVLLKSEFYMHKQYKKTFVPIINIVDWVAMDKEPDGDAVEDEAEEAPAPRRRRTA